VARYLDELGERLDALKDWHRVKAWAVQEKAVSSCGVGQLASTCRRRPRRGFGRVKWR
jgi:hypothetical protein